MGGYYADDSDLIDEFYREQTTEFQEWLHYFRHFQDDEAPQSHCPDCGCENNRTLRIFGDKWLNDCAMCGTVWASTLAGEYIEHFADASDIAF